MGKKLLRVIGISSSQTQTGAYALILSEIGSNRRIPIIIGSHEAQSIAIQLEKMKPSRPLTHDLFKSFADAFQINVVEVVITKFVEGVFHSVLICKRNNDFLNLDARTSDAVALALRFECPIFAEEEVIDKTSIELEEEHIDFIEDEEDEENDDIFDEEDEQDDKKFSIEELEIRPANLHRLNMKELEELLDHYIQSEQYEMASKVRDEINSRKK